jgi:hypothetical protein
MEQMFHFIISPLYGTGSKPPGCHGPHLKSRFIAKNHPLKNPNFFNDSTA